MERGGEETRAARRGSRTPDVRGGPRRRRARLEDVARRVGVSTASVSLVLRNAAGPSAETRRKVLAAAAELGYRPDRTASLLARRRTHLLGVLLDIRSSFHAELVTDLHDAADGVGYDLVLSTVTATRDEKRALDTLVDSRCEALVLLGPTAPAPRLAELAQQLPVVVVGRAMGGTALDVVRTADDVGVGQAVAHLHSLGHQAIAYVDGGRGAIATARRNGYRKAMRAAGLAAQAQVLPGDPTEQSGTRAAQSLLADQRPPTALVAFNDRCALGLLDGLLRAGVWVPGQLSVVGYDDSPAARLPHVDLTTVSQDPRAQAEHAVTAALERLDGGRTRPREVVLRPHLVVRGSTGPPRRSRGLLSAAG